MNPGGVLAFRAGLWRAYFLCYCMNTRFINSRHGIKTLCLPPINLNLPQDPYIHHDNKHRMDRKSSTHSQGPKSKLDIYLVSGIRKMFCNFRGFFEENRLLNVK